jgi:site-specific DNA-methyltransferase (adenine-specific)
MTALPRNTIVTGDAGEVLATLPEASVDCVVTSPPYYQLRDYGASGQLGREASV